MILEALNFIRVLYQASPMAGGLICKLWIINLKSTSLSVRCLPPRSILARIAAAVIKSWATAQDTFRIFRTILAILYSSTFRSVQSVCIILAILHQSTFRIFKLFLQYLQYLQYWTKVLFCREGAIEGQLVYSGFHCSKYSRQPGAIGHYCWGGTFQGQDHPLKTFPFFASDHSTY